MEETQKGFGWDRFVKVQQHLPKVEKAGKGNYGSYMKLEDLNPKLLKLLNDNGFVWITMPVIQDGKPCLNYSIVDQQSGVSIGGVMDLKMAQDTPQAQGSAITYARRYSLTAMTGIVADMDDDGAAGSKPPSDNSKSIEEMTKDIDNCKNIDERRKYYAGLSPDEKKLALPIIQAKSAEMEAA